MSHAIAMSTRKLHALVIGVMPARRAEGCKSER
jgi:hypothetical protein